MTGTPTAAPANEGNDLALCAARLDMIADDVQKLAGRYEAVLTDAEWDRLAAVVTGLRTVVTSLFQKAVAG